MNVGTNLVLILLRGGALQREEPAARAGTLVTAPVVS